MASLGDRVSLQALERLLARPRGDATEELLAMAVEGLGHSRNRRYLPAIQRVRSGFQSPAARLTGACAAYLCGAEEAMQEVVAFLRTPEDSEEVIALKIQAVEFMARHFQERLAMPLADLVLRTGDGRLATHALQCLMAATGYRRSDRPGLATPAEKPPPELLYDPHSPPSDNDGDGDGATASRPALSPEGLPADLSDLDAEERRELVDRILRWWQTEGREQFRQKATEEDREV